MCTEIFNLIQIKNYIAKIEQQMKNSHENLNDYEYNQINNKSSMNGNPTLRENKKQGEQLQSQHLSSNNANSVNSSALIFRARQIYEKYQKPQNRQSYFDQVSHPYRNTSSFNDAFQPDAGKNINFQGRDIATKDNAKLQPILVKKDSKNFKNQLTTAETVPSSTSIQVKRAERDANKLQNFLYMLIGICSSHIRVIERFTFQRISHYQRSVKRTTQIKKRQTKIDSLKSQHFLLEESAVEKGLKFLQERSNKRKQLEMQMRQSANLQQKSKVQHQIKQQRNQQQNIANKNDVYQLKRFPESNQKKQIKSLQQKVSPFNRQTDSAHKVHEFKSKQNTQHTQRQQQEDIYLKLERQQQRNRNRDQGQEQQQDQARERENQQERQRQRQRERETERQIQVKREGQKEARRKAQREAQRECAQREDIEQKKPSWITLKLEEQPLQNVNKRQLFQRKQISQRRYYLNPNLFQQAQPDINNELFVPNSMNFFSEQNEDEIEPEINKKFGERTTTDLNLHEEALPMFDPQLGPKKNQASGQQYLNFQSKQGSLMKQSKNDQFEPQAYEYQQFDNLPSFNGKKLVLVKNQGNFIQNHQNEQRERRKSDLMGYKSRESSFKISDEGEDHIDENNGKMNFKKLHKLEQYYTDNNVMSKNNGRPSFDSSKHKLKKPVRPKSMSHGAQPSYQNRFIPGMEQKKIQIHQDKNQGYAKPTIRISYQSPRNQAVVSNQLQYQPPIPAMINFKPNFEYHNEMHKKVIPIVTHSQNIGNKPRAVSSEPRLIGQVYFQRSTLPPPQQPYRPEMLRPNIIIPVHESQQMSPRMVNSSPHPYQFSGDNYPNRSPARVEYSQAPQMPYSTPILLQSRPVIQSYYKLNSKQQIPKKKGIEVNLSPKKPDEVELNHYKSETRLRQLRPSPREKQGESSGQGSNSKRLQTISTEYF